MKKAFAILLVLVMGVSFVACGASAGGEVKEPAKVEIGGTEAAEKPAQTEDSAAVQSTETEVSIEETLLVDEGGVKITAKGLRMGGLFGPELKLLIENNSGKDLTVQCRNVSVNGYMVETMMSVDVVNGKKANDSITFMASDLEISGITAIADMEFSFHMFTTADWEAYLDTAPIQLKTSIADTYEYAFDDSGEVAYDAGGIKVIIKGLAEDTSIWGPSVVVYIENNTDKAFTVQARDVSVNGFMLDPIFSCDVMPGKKAVDTITFMDTQLEENEIGSIENIELSFRIFDFESWDTIVDTDVVSMAF